MSEKGKKRLRDGRELSVHANRGLHKICACPRRTWAKCPHGWHFSYALKGRHYRFSLAKHVGPPITSRTEAKATADWIRTAIREGTLVVGRQAGSGNTMADRANAGGLTFDTVDTVTVACSLATSR